MPPPNGGLVPHQQTPLRDRLVALVTRHEEPSFSPSRDSTLIEFAKLFLDSGLYSFDANKHLRPDALSPIYDCETESRITPGSEADRFVAIWTPVWEHTDPVTGFRTGHDSTFLGSTPTVAMPQDERTAALLLLVTTTFVHLSASYEGAGPLVQGAVETDDNRYRFLRLDPAATPSSTRTAHESGEASRDDNGRPG
jgi:hypothetical protein